MAAHNYESAARELGLSVRAVKRLVEQRRIEFWKTANSRQGHVRIEDEAIAEFKRRHCTPARRAS